MSSCHHRYIREALSILKHENLLSVAPKSRTQVVLMNKRLLMESRYLRCVMEEKILKRILEKDTEPLQQQLLRTVFYHTP